MNTNKYTMRQEYCGVKDLSISKRRRDKKRQDIEKLQKKMAGT